MNRMLTCLGLLVLLSSSVSAKSGRVYNVGGDVKAPIALERPPIDYSACKLEGKRLSGIPIAEAVVSEDGQVASVKILKGVEPCLDRTFLENLRAWRFKPGTLKGKPVAVRMSFTLHIHYR